MKTQFPALVALLVAASISASLAQTPSEGDAAIDTTIGDLVANTGDFVKTLRDEVKILDDEPTGAVTGRGKKYNKLAIGMVIGVKFLSLVYSFMMAVKALALKALLISKFGLITTIVVGIKYMMERMGDSHPNVTPYHSSHQQWSSVPVWTSGGWNEVASGSEISQSHASYPVSGSEISQAVPSEEVGASELQAHVANLYQSNYVPKTAERKSQILLPTKYKTTVYKTTIKKYEQ